MQEHLEFVGYEGVCLRGDARGHADAWPVLFLHGAGQTRHAWGSTAQSVAERGWRSITLDLRGHGDSDWALSGDYSLAAVAADITAVASQLTRFPVLVGASLGGVASILAEGIAADTFSVGLVLVDIATKPNPEGVARIGSFMRSGLNGFDSLDAAAEAIASYTPQRKRAVSHEGLMKVLRKRDDRWYWHWDPAFLATSRVLYASAPGEFRGFPVRTISVPTMLVRGLLSDMVTDDGIAELFSLIPSATLVEVGGAAHMIAGDKNDAFSEAVLTFLEVQVRPTLDASRLTGDGRNV